MLGVSPLTFFILVRCIFPIIWCLIYLFTNEYSTINSNSYDTVLLHLLYLIIQTILLYILYINLLRFKVNVIEKKGIITTDKNSLALSLPIVIALYISIFSQGIPLFMDGGSDAIVSMGEESKNSTWIISGLISSLQIVLIFLNFRERNKFWKIFIYLFIVFSFLVNGKKASILTFILDFSFISFLLQPKRIKVNLKSIFLIISVALMAILFAIVQFFRTVGIEISSETIAFGFTYLSDLTYGSFTAYLSQIIDLGGINSIEDYSISLGTLGSLKYLFNSFTQFFLGIGIQKAIGPYLTYYIYGSEFPNGVNPTLFFEFVFVFGSKYAGVVSILLLPIIIYSIYLLSVKIYYSSKYNPFDSSINLYLLFFLLTFLVDSLNAIRSLPFIILIILLKKVYKIIFKIV